MLLRYAALTVVVLLVAACDGGRVVETDSGLRGMVTIGPQCPVVQEGEECPDAPFRAELRIRRAGDEQVTTARSGTDGRFQVALAPGRYVIEPVSPNEGAPPYAAPLDVQVDPHRYTPVTIAYDSGIR